MSQSEELDKAKDLIRAKKIARLQDANVNLKDHFVVDGSDNEQYLVILPAFCTCMHFHINCIKTPGMICKHILACRMVGSNIPEIVLDNWQSLLFDKF